MPVQMGNNQFLIPHRPVFKEYDIQIERPWRIGKTPFAAESFFYSPQKPQQGPRLQRCGNFNHRIVKIVLFSVSEGGVFQNRSALDGLERRESLQVDPQMLHPTLRIPHVAPDSDQDAVAISFPFAEPFRKIRGFAQSMPIVEPAA